MKTLCILLFTTLIFHHMIIFDFDKDSDLSKWRIVDDVVMGGRSDGAFEINEEGHAVFHGQVSLENNGGFSSVRYRFPQKEVSNYHKASLRLKGDGKQYQFRIKSDDRDAHSYVYTFETSGDWETIEIPLADMIPQFRGRQLKMPNYPRKVMKEIAFLIGNKKPQDFTLILDDIILK